VAYNVWDIEPPWFNVSFDFHFRASHFLDFLANLKSPCFSSHKL
jgi:hypothetical protein